MNSLVSRIAEFIVFTMLVFILCPAPAHAYIDVGTGSYLFQCALGMLFGVWMSVKAMLARRG